MKVVLVVRRPLPGQHSIERTTRSLHSELAKNVTVKTWAVPYESRGVVRRFGNVVFTAIAARTRFRRHVLHLTGDINYVAMLLPSDRLVVTVHDLTHLQATRGLRRRFLSLIWFEIPGRRASAIVAVSTETANQLRLHIVDSAPVAVIPSAIGAEFWTEAVSERSDRPRVLQVGTRPNKNLAAVAMALRDLDVELRIIGDPSAEDRRLLANLRLHYSVVAPKSDPEMVQEYRKSSVLVFASLAEGFGMPIAEAMAIGLPVVTSNRDPMRSVADGAAILVDPERPADIRRGIVELLVDDATRARCIEIGRRVSLRYHPAVAANSYLEIYRSTAAGKAY